MLDRPTALERHILRLARRHGIDYPPALERQSMLARDKPDAELRALAQTIRQLREVMDDELFGLTRASVGYSIYQVFMKSVLHLRTLGEFVNELAVVVEQLAPAKLRFHLVHEAGYVSLVVSRVQSIDNSLDLYWFWSLMCAHRLMGWCIDERIALRRVELQSSRAELIEDLAHVFDCEAAVGQEHNAIQFSSHYLERPIRRSISDLEDTLPDRPLCVLHIAGRDESFRHRVYRALRRHIGSEHRTLSASQIADDLGCSSTQLARRLKHEGTSLNGLRKRVRLELAQHWLLNGCWPVEKIAGQLGFEEPNSFSRSFKQWTGVSPAAYRRRGGLTQRSE